MSIPKPITRDSSSSNKLVAERSAPSSQVSQMPDPLFMKEPPANTSKHEDRNSKPISSSRKDSSRKDSSRSPSRHHHHHHHRSKSPSRDRSRHSETRNRSRSSRSPPRSSYPTTSAPHRFGRVEKVREDDMNKRNGFVSVFVGSHV